jgi:hypothetical protein
MKKNKRKKKKKKKNPLVKPNDRVRECVCTQLSPGAAPATTQPLPPPLIGWSLRVTTG